MVHKISYVRKLLAVYASDYPLVHVLTNANGTKIVSRCCIKLGTEGVGLQVVDY